jgi:uncharacterized protein
MKVWIDLSNSPHPLLFEPIARRLEESGTVVCVTARDNAQTVELVRERWPAAEVIGGPSPGARAAKGRALLARVRALTDWARSAKPDVALSHGSYAQIVSARKIRVPVVTAMDYEHQPANHLAFRLASRVLLPAALRGTRVARQGATGSKTRFYDGLKEELYLGEFAPDSGVLETVGIEPESEAAVVVARTPPSGALYHRSGSRLFLDAVTSVAEQGARCVVLARRPEQRREISALGLPNVVLPERAIDARSLMYAADLVIGGGGTMTREAALLGVPTVSVFAGRTPAVDRWLEQRGALRRLRSIDELPPVERTPCARRDPGELRAHGKRLVADFVGVVEEFGSSEAVRIAPAHVDGELPDLLLSDPTTSQGESSQPSQPLVRGHE